MKNKFSKYFEKLDELEEEFYVNVTLLETEMKEHIGSDIEFFWSEGHIVGIGNEDRTMKLVQRY